MNVVHGRVAVGALLGAVAFSSPVTAQEVRKLDFGLSATAEYNSNVARTSKADAELRGLNLSDTIFTPNATIDAVVPVGRHAVFVAGGAGYSFYHQNKELNRERLDFTGGVRSRVGPCASTLTGGYARGISEVDDPLLVENVKNIQETNRASLDVLCSRATGLGVVGSISKIWTHNDLAVAELSDSERTSLMAGVSYARPALGTVTVFGNRDQVEYPKRLIEDGYDLAAIGVTFERQLGARIQGSVTIAYTKVDPHAAVDENLETTAYSGSLSYRASNRLRAQAIFDRSVTPSTGLGGAYDLTNSYRLSADYDLGSRIMISLGGAVIDRDSQGGLDFPTIQLSDSRTTTVFGSVLYKQSQRLSFRVNAGREKRTTNLPQFDYTNNRIGLTADLAF